MAKTCQKWQKLATREKWDPRIGAGWAVWRPSGEGQGAKRPYGPRWVLLVMGPEIRDLGPAGCTEVWL